MKPENQAVMDGIMENVRGLSLTQRRALLQAMKNPYFFPIAFCLADADEDKSSCAHCFISALMRRKSDKVKIT